MGVVEQNVLSGVLRGVATATRRQRTELANCCIESAVLKSRERSCGVI